MVAKEAIFHKYEACGNDYLVVPFQSEWFSSDSGFIQKICSTQYGVGSDGVLLDGGPGKRLDRILRIFNPDGSEAEKSGNGIRIFGRYLKDIRFWKEADIGLETRGGDVRLFQEEDQDIKVNMGAASFDPSDIPLNDVSPWFEKELRLDDRKFEVTCLSLGNPHCVIRFENLPSDQEVRSIGPMIENYPLFSNRINVQFVRVLDNQNIEMKIWERGAGFTESSGSSSCAAVAALSKLELVDRKCQVQMPGGVLSVEVGNEGIWLKGPVKKIFTGTLSPEFLLY